MVSPVQLLFCEARYFFSQQNLWRAKRPKTELTLSILMAMDAINKGSWFQTNLQASGSQVENKIRESIRHKIVVIVYMQINTQTSFMLGVLGIWVFMTGMNAMKAKVRVAIIEILPESGSYWKKISRVIKPNIQRGTKIWIRLAPGNLQSGILKLAQRNQFILVKVQMEQSFAEEFPRNFIFQKRQASVLWYLPYRQYLAILKSLKLTFLPLITTSTSSASMQLNLMSIFFFLTVLYYKSGSIFLIGFVLFQSTSSFLSSQSGSMVTFWTTTVKCRFKISNGLQSTSLLSMQVNYFLMRQCIMHSSLSRLMEMPSYSLRGMGSLAVICRRMRDLPFPISYLSMFLLTLPQQKENSKVPETSACIFYISTSRISLTLKRTQQGRQQMVRLDYSWRSTSLVEYMDRGYYFFLIGRSY